MARRATKKKSASKRTLKYQKRDYSAGRKRAEQSASTRDNYINDDIRLFKPAEGENLIRILPPTWDDPEHYGFDIFVHYNIGADNAAYLCPLKNKGEPCPICEARETAEAEGDTEYAKKLRPTKRVLFYLVDRDKEEEGLKAWAAPWTIDKDIAIQATDSRNREFFPVDDPEEGFDVSITRDGQGTNTKYSVAIARRESEIELTDEIMDVLEDMPVPDMLIYFEYDHIEQIFSGGHVQQEDDEEEDDEKPSRKSSRKSSKAKPKTPTYEEVQELVGEELDDIIDKLGLDLDPNSFGSDEELVEAICEALGLTDEPPTKADDDEKDSDSGGDDNDSEEEESDPDEEPEGKKKVRNRLEGLRKRRNKK